MSAYFESEFGRLYHGDCMEHFGKISAICLTALRTANGM